MKLFNPYVNGNMSLDDLGETHVEEIAPEVNWLEAAVAQYKLDPIFLADETPVTFVSQWDAYAYVHFANKELARFRNAVATNQIDEASLKQADRLLLTGGWWELPTVAQMQRVMAGLEGNFEFGTRDGKALTMQGRPLPHISAAIERDTGVPWEDKTVRHTFGVLWQRTKDRYDADSKRPSPDDSVVCNPRGARNGYPELSGGASWYNDDEQYFAAAYRLNFNYPGNRNCNIGLRLVRPRTP